MVTKISLLRKTSLGIQGTFANANHHAQTLLPMIEALRPQILSMGFTDWRQGHNVHEFVTADARRFTLRPFTRDGSYVGLRLSFRLSRSKEIFLTDCDNVRDLPQLVAFMQNLAAGLKGDATPLLAK